MTRIQTPTIGPQGIGQEMSAITVAFSMALAIPGLVISAVSGVTANSITTDPATEFLATGIKDIFTIDQFVNLNRVTIIVSMAEAEVWLALMPAKSGEIKPDSSQRLCKCDTSERQVLVRN